jgi:hypothetical protein
MLGWLHEGMGLLGYATWLGEITIVKSEEKHFGKL